MYTTCPRCHTVFRISAAEVRVAEGSVRCGGCALVFSALTTLRDSPLPVSQDLPTPDENALEFPVPENRWAKFLAKPPGPGKGSPAGWGRTRGPTIP